MDRYLTDRDVWKVDPEEQDMRRMEKAFLEIKKDMPYIDEGLRVLFGHCEGGS